MKINNLWGCILSMMIFAGCRSVQDIPAVDGFVLDKYLGKWYEIYRLPNWFESGMSQVSAEYFLLENGNIRVINRGIKDGMVKTVYGYARFRDRKDSGELEVSFFRPFYAAYRIIKLAPDYRYSVVVSANKKYLWILSRNPQLSQSDRFEIFSFLKKQKFPVEKLIEGQ